MSNICYKINCNNESIPRGKYCFTHKTGKRCSEKTCRKRPNYNFEGETLALYCKTHCKAGMIDIKRKTCLEDSCKRRPTYSQPGMNLSHCYLHKEEGMVKEPFKKCENCLEYASYGISEILRCEIHKNEDDYNLSERKCIKCYKIDVLNKEGLCVNFCSYEERDKIMKKNKKKKEEFVLNLLKLNIRQDLFSYDQTIDSICSKKRPDFVFHCGDHILIIEVDEFQHKSYTNCGYTK